MSDDETEYRIEYTVQRRKSGQDDFEDIGFGSSGGWSTIGQCSHMLGSAVDRGEWEIEQGMPDPADVMAEQSGARS